MPRPLPYLLALSGAAALTCEVVWMRRLALVSGSSALATTLTLSLYMLGLGLGGALGGRLRWSRPPRGYGALEIAVAGWALAVPAVILLTRPLAGSLAGGATVAAAVLVPAGLAHGATLPAASAAVARPRDAALLYGSNTAGAVVGCLLAAFVWLPLLGMRGTELLAAAVAATAGVGALTLSRQVEPPPIGTPVATPTYPLFAAAVAGLVAMSLEVAWSRLGALLLGGSVYAFSLVLAVFLAGIAVGAALGRRWGAAAVGPALVALGLLAVAGTAAWRLLPHGLALAFAAGGDGAVLPAGAVLMATAMAGAPIASGVVFAAALSAADADAPARAAGRVLAANTAGSVIGAAAAGLLGLPLLGVRGTTLLVGGIAVAAGMPTTRRRLVPVAAFTSLALLSPRWDPALYAVGLFGRLGEFSDFSPAAIERFAHDGWTLLSYRDGRSASVAVGQSTTTSNRWLSINGKVDASDGADMPTQQLSGALPVLVAQSLDVGDIPALVVGLASGVTAGEALATGASTVTVVELEPAVVEASALFDHVNHHVLDDPRTTLVLADARAVLARQGPAFRVIISEPSNPWLTGVSNLFTREYWQLARARLDDDGVFCQWVQLYDLPPTAFRSLVRTFLDVFPDAWLFETIPGADALLLATTRPIDLPTDLPLAPTLGPDGLASLAGQGLLAAPLNTDDRPWIEFEAPHWLNRDTAAANEALISKARRASAPDFSPPTR